MPTIDEMHAQRELFEKETRSGLRLKARPTPFLADNGKTCKTCKFACRYTPGNKTVYKCLLNQARWTASVNTDIRLKDPACNRYEEEEQVSPQ